MHLIRHALALFCLLPALDSFQAMAQYDDLVGSGDVVLTKYQLHQPCSDCAYEWHAILEMRRWAYHDQASYRTARAQCAAAARSTSTGPNVAFVCRCPNLSYSGQCQ